MIKQSAEFIELIIQAAISVSFSGYNAEYKVYILPKDFHPIASQIKYFALVDNERKIVGLSEEVPEKFRHIWVRHEIECGLADCEACYSITLIDITDVKDTFTHSDYKEFLERKTELYRTLIEAIPNHPALHYLKTSLYFLENALKS